MTARPYIWNGGERGAPPADSLVRVPGDTTLWSVQIWFMAQGSYGVRVHVDGAAGSGTAVVPFAAVATAVLGMDRPFAGLLAALGLFLGIGFLTLIGAGAREGTLEPGLQAEPARVRASWRIRAIATVLVLALLAGGATWWRAENNAYARKVFRNVKGITTIRAENGRNLLRLGLDSVWDYQGRWRPIIPDHGKMMHLFLVRSGDLGALAHLHPELLDTVFVTALPALPAGQYRVFGDIVHENGFAETIVSSVQLGDSTGGGAAGPDDATFVGAPSGAAVAFADGSRLAWDRGARDIAIGQDDRCASRCATHRERCFPWNPTSAWRPTP